MGNSFSADLAKRRIAIFFADDEASKYFKSVTASEVEVESGYTSNRLSLTTRYLRSLKLLERQNAKRYMKSA